MMDLKVTCNLFIVYRRRPMDALLVEDSFVLAGGGQRKYHFLSWTNHSSTRVGIH